MACPNCSHTMANVGLSPVGRTFWCPRCGTLKTASTDPDLSHSHVVPKWTRPEMGVPVCLRSLALLGRLAYDAFAVDDARLFCRERPGDVQEAIDKVRIADATGGG